MPHAVLLKASNPFCFRIPITSTPQIYKHPSMKNMVSSFIFQHTTTSSLLLITSLLLLLLHRSNHVIPFAHAFTSHNAVILPSSSSSMLQMSSEENDRAHMAKKFEDMMDNDWREFRAKLVAREKAREVALDDAKTKQQNQQVTVANTGGSSNSKEMGKEGGEKLLTDVITGAFSSIFKKNNKNSAATAASSETMFQGNVGGATASNNDFPISLECSDPFLSVEECHLLYEEYGHNNSNGGGPLNVEINKHRWAHPLSHVEGGCVLIANEKLGGVFHQTVVLIIDHHEKIGSTGMIINRPFPGDLLKTASEIDNCNIDTNLKNTFRQSPVSYGGPVMQDQFSTLHGFGLVPGSKKVCRGVFVGGSAELMLEVNKKTMNPSEVLFVKGHAAWVPGQLSREIEKGVWYVAAASADLILRYAGAPVMEEDNTKDLWADVLSCMGGKYEEVAKAYGGRGDRRIAP